MALSPEKKNELNRFALIGILRKVDVKFSEGIRDAKRFAREAGITEEEAVEFAKELWHEVVEVSFNLPKKDDVSVTRV